VFYNTGNDTTIAELLECEPQDFPVYSELLTLPSEYFSGHDESSVLDSLNEFLRCRLSMGAYGFLNSDAFPTFEFIDIELDEITGDDYFSFDDDWYYDGCDYDDSRRLTHTNDYVYMGQMPPDDYFYMGQMPPDDYVDMSIYYGNIGDDLPNRDDYMNQNDDWSRNQNDYFYSMDDDGSNYYCSDDPYYQDDYFAKKPSGTVTIICDDKCHNGVFCRDILTQFTTELACLTKNTCRFMYWDAIHIDYEVEFQTGEQFESYTWLYQRDVEMRMERNFREYIKCRFEDDPRYDDWFFDVYGWIWDSTFNMICFSDCNTIPYCDALRLRRKEDSKDDLCYKKWIEVGDDERVITVYDYSIDYGSTANGLTGLFSYNVQSMSGDPIMRQYYGSWALSDLPALTSAQEATQASQLKNLMELYGFNEPDVNFNDVCTHLTYHIKCEENKRIIQIDMEIPNGNGFKANTIKNHFGNALQSLTLGINLQEPKDLPNTFFEIPGLITLTLRGRGKLIGSLPTSLGDLCELKNLDLNQCPFLGNDHEGIAGPIPSEIGLLPMKLIDLGCNKFTGEIPDEFYKDTDETPKFYKVITLNDNNFMGTISDDLNYMFTLTQLSLARNRFSGAFPSSLFLWKLKLLDAQKNRDPEITNCAQESASGNYGFTGPLPDILKNPLSKLEVVSLNDNCFTGTIPREIKWIENLKYLNLQNNDLTGAIPRQVVKCENLEVLLLGGNPQLDYYVHPKIREFLTERGVIHDLTW